MVPSNGVTVHGTAPTVVRFKTEDTEPFGFNTKHLLHFIIDTTLNITWETPWDTKPTTHTI